MPTRKPPTDKPDKPGGKPPDSTEPPTEPIDPTEPPTEPIDPTEPPAEGTGLGRGALGRMPLGAAA